MLSQVFFFFHFVQQFQSAFSSLLSIEVFAAWSAYKLTLVKLLKNLPETSSRWQMEVNPTLITEQEERQHPSADGPELENQAEELAYVLHTSGTTGLPKIVKVPHKCIVPNIVHIR